MHTFANGTRAHAVAQVSVQQHQLEGVWQVCVVPLDGGLFICIQLELFFGLTVQLQVGADVFSPTY